MDMAKMEKGIREDMGKLEKGIREDVGKLEKGIREDMGQMEERITKNVMAGTKMMLEAWNGEIIHQMMVLNEELIHDFRGALNDKVSLHDDHLKRHDSRLTRIETHLHLVA